MKFYTTLFILFIGQLCFAQTEPLLFAEEMPRFPGCENEEMNITEKAECSNQRLLSFVYQHITYPDSALAHNIEGTVVLRFVVTAEGKVDDIDIVKDIGDGCGAEAKRVIEKLNADSIRWIPGKVKGEAKDVYMTLPVKFKIQAPPPDFVLIDNDTVYTKYHSAASFPGGHEALLNQLQSGLNYPPEWVDSCYVGIIGCDLLVRGNGQVLVLDSYNYAQLPEDFIFDIIHHVARTSGQWTLATYSGSPVSTIYPIRLRVAPPNNVCTEKETQLDTSREIGTAGIQLYNEDKYQEAIAKWDEAINLFPESIEFRMWRGAAHVENNNFAAACPDLKKVKAVLGDSGFDNLLPLICREESDPEE